MPALTSNQTWATNNRITLGFAVLFGVICWDLPRLVAEELAVAPLSAVLSVTPDMADLASSEDSVPGTADTPVLMAAAEDELDANGPVIPSRSPHRVTSADRIEELPEDTERGKQWLIEAHALATEATLESQLTQVLDLCHRALATALEAELREYTLRLSAWALNRRGEFRVDSGHDEEAQADFEAAVKLDPTCWKAIHNRGVTYAQIGMFHEAFDDFCQTIKLCPTHAKAHSNRGALYEQSGDLDSALDDYRRAIELDPALAFAHAGRGRVSHHLRSLDVALDELNEAIRLAPKNAAFYKSRADIHADRGNYQAALLDYGRAVELNPLLAEAYRNGAWLLATCPDDRFRSPDNAMEGATRAIELTQGNRHLYLDTLAAAQANAGRFDDAVQTAGMAIEEAPDAYRSFYEARRAYYQEGKPFRTKPVRR